jgi:transcriptional regulator of acetoin/glycerol metabolism
MAATSSDKEQKPPKGTADSVTPREIALGRDPYFKSLARQTGAAHWRQWAERGITRRTVARRFGRAFHQAAQRAERIHFAIDEIAVPIDAVKKGAAGFKPGNFTNAELHYIATNPELLRKTIFYRAGKVVQSPFK